MKFITPLYCIVLLVAWSWQSGADMLLMRNVPPENQPWVWATRALIIGMFLAFSVMVHRAAKRWGEARP
jgi:RsiW-degrading membrane proteinase PrsW (M82 family)